MIRDLWRESDPVVKWCGLVGLILHACVWALFVGYLLALIISVTV